MSDPSTRTERQLSTGLTRRLVAVLLVSVLIIAACGLLYELLISTISAYFLGNSVLHFSVTIGLFMSAMGIGSYLSRFIRSDLLSAFVYIEIALGIIGGLSGLLLYATFAFTENYYLFAFALIMLLGAGIGLEIPLLTRIVRPFNSLREAVSQVLSFDYFGALLASLVFPLLLLPYLGTMRTGFVVGLLNLAVAVLNLSVFRDSLPKYRRQLAITFGGIVLLLVCFLYSFRMIGFFEAYMYDDQIVLAEQSQYQRIIMTRWQDDYRLYLDGRLQFSTMDEYRYHEPLVHFPMLLAHQPKKILILGGGDGLAARELLKYDQVKHIDLVDLDPMVTQVAKTHPALKRLNEGALTNEKVHLKHGDGFNYLEDTQTLYDLIIVDLPDPSTIEVGKLYSRSFYQLAAHRLRPGGVFITQSSSPYFAPKSFWMIHHTMETAFPYVQEVFSVVPSFGGIWGFNVGVKPPGRKAADSLETKQMQTYVLNRVRSNIKAQGKQLNLKYMTADHIDDMLTADPDFSERPTEINTLDNQLLVGAYEEGWNTWME